MYAVATLSGAWSSPISRWNPIMSERYTSRPQCRHVPASASYGSPRQSSGQWGQRNSGDGERSSGRHFGRQATSGSGEPGRRFDLERVANDAADQVVVRDARDPDVAQGQDRRCCRADSAMSAFIRTGCGMSRSIFSICRRSIRTSAVLTNESERTGSLRISPSGKSRQRRGQWSAD